MKYEKDTSKPDMVNHPPHYTKGTIEIIDVIKNNVRDFSSYCEGTIIKYISRYRFKNGVEDLEKAKWYLTRLIEHENGKNVDGKPQNS